MATPHGAGLAALPLLELSSAMIRPASKSDRTQICWLECACFGWERLLFGLWPRIGRRGISTWIAEVGEKAAGYSITYYRELDHQMVWYVGGIGVLQPYRHNGIAQQLMAAVFSDHPTLWLHVRATNRAALNLYEKLGMHELRRITRFYSNGDDAIVMVTHSYIN